jgi:hypothetical protein
MSNFTRRLRRSNRRANPIPVALCFIVRDTRVLAVVETLDEQVHTDDHPFCDDATCECHHDTKYVYENVGRLLVEGKLTEDEATTLFSGQLASAAEDEYAAYQVECPMTSSYLDGANEGYPLGQPHRSHEEWQDYL